MMIALEGPDGAGKSTLANNLAHAIGYGIYHPGGPATDTDEFRLRLTAQERQEAVVHDRLMAVSEPIYARALGRPTYPAVGRLADYYLRNIRYPIYLIYCRLSSINEMFDNISQERKAHKTEEHIANMRRSYVDIVDAYDSRIKELSSMEYPMIVPIMFNWYVHDVGDIIERIKELRP